MRKKWIKAMLQLVAGLLALQMGIGEMGTGECFSWWGWCVTVLGIVAALFAAEDMIAMADRSRRWR